MRVGAEAAALNAIGAAGLSAAPAGAAVRHVWVDAVPVSWNIVPDGRVETHMEQGMIGIYRVKRR